MVETNQGKRVYSLVADSAYLYGDERQIEVFHPRIEFFNESGARFSTLVANRGTVYTNTSDLTARLEVIVNTQDSTLLFTDSLRWLNSEKKVVTDSWVKIHTKEGEIEGRGLVSDAQLKKIEILEKITGTSPYRFGP